MENSKTTESIHFVTPDAVRADVEKFSGLVAKVLETCYGMDYPGSALDAQSNLKAITEGTQKTVIWAITDQEWLDERIGTSSMVESSEEFGKGFAEMGKSGSIGVSGAKYGYMRFFEEWQKEHPELKQFSSLVTTVRNCPEREGKNDVVKGGIGIRRIFLKYLKFEQWGIAPWLLMPDASDGSFELLDLLFKFRNQKEIINYFTQNKISFASDQHRDLLMNFIKYNYGDINVEFNEALDVKTRKGWSFLVSKVKSDKNPAKIVPADNDNEFNAVFVHLSKEDCACKVVYLPLTEDSVEIQKMLNDQSWILTGFVPGRQTEEGVEHARGMWIKLNKNRPVVKPDYLLNPDEYSPEWYYDFVNNLIKSF